MSFWKALVPDEPFVLDESFEDTRYPEKLPPVVKAWCVVSLIANGFVVAIATPIFRNVGPLLVGAIFALFPLWMVLFWKDLASSMNEAKQKAVASAMYVAPINLSLQWCAISMCVAAPAMVIGACTLLYFNA